MHPGRFILWVDDSISTDLREHMIASPLTPAMLSWIQPKSTRGLDSEDLLALKSWLDDPTVILRIRHGTDYPEGERPIGGAEEHYGDQ